MINVEIDGLDVSDYPDFVDAYIAYAEHDDGTPLSEQELESIPYEIVYEYVMDFAFDLSVKRLDEKYKDR